jgi:hypothetical protein
MAKRSRHKNKEIEAAVRYAESKGWTCAAASGHAWGILWCPHPQRSGCHFSIWSTPRNPVNFARLIRRKVDQCPHGE